MQPKVKHFSFMPHGALADRLGRSCAFILCTNWLTQGMRGMDRKELAFRMLFEALIVLFLNMGLGVSLLMALVAGHTINFTFNGQLWVCVRYCPFYRRDPAVLDQFLDRLTHLVRRSTAVHEALCIGSQGGLGSRRTERSDIDLRVIFAAGLRGWLSGNLLLIKLRSEALVRGVPLDLYGYDDLRSLARFDQREPLLVLLDRRGRIERELAHRTLVWRPSWA